MSYVEELDKVTRERDAAFRLLAVCSATNSSNMAKLQGIRAALKGAAPPSRRLATIRAILDAPVGAA